MIWQARSADILTPRMGGGRKSQRIEVVFCCMLVCPRVHVEPARAKSSTSPDSLAPWHRLCCSRACMCCWCWRACRCNDYKHSRTHDEKPSSIQASVCAYAHNPGVARAHHYCTHARKVFMPDVCVLRSGRPFACAYAVSHVCVEFVGCCSKIRTRMFGNISVLCTCGCGWQQLEEFGRIDIYNIPNNGMSDAPMCLPENYILFIHNLDAHKHMHSFEGYNQHSSSLQGC